MTYPRGQLIDTANAGFYHCISRCVRRAFLCGFDRLTGKNFNHRRDWIEKRILELPESFAVSVYAYAVMANHLHVVVRTDPQAAFDWSDEEVARRWLMVFPGSLGNSKDSRTLESAIVAICSDPERLAELRRRLGSLSWFMRALNEPIARMANREDGCTHGRSFRKRFFRCETAQVFCPLRLRRGRRAKRAGDARRQARNRARKASLALGIPPAHCVRRPPSRREGGCWRILAQSLRENRTCCTPCAGRFWEGRFKCQALLDEQAILSCMAYVDLNPVRAGLCDQLNRCDHTSVQRRIKGDTGLLSGFRSDNRNLDQPLKPVAGLSVDDLLDMTEASYIELVQWTGEQARPDKRGKLSAPHDQTPVPDALWSVAQHPKQWLRQVQGTESCYYREKDPDQPIGASRASTLPGFSNIRPGYTSSSSQPPATQLATSQSPKL